MKLKNEALQKLYDKLASDIFGYTTTINKAFEECDNELFGSATLEQIKNIQTSNDILERSNSILLDANVDLAREKHKLEKDLDDLLSRAHCAEDEVEGLKKKLDFQQSDIVRLRKDRDRKDEAIAKLAEIRDELQQKVDDLKEDYGKLSEKNRKLNARTDCLRLEVEWYRKHYKEQYDKTQELKKQLGELTSQYQKLTIENKRLQNNVRAGYDQGQTDLWVKLQNVNDAKPFELATCFPDVSCMDDILSWDLEDFLDAYKNWYKAQEQERTKHMRDHLVRFCLGRPCCDCPLHTDGFICGREKGFSDMTYEELKKHYDKATDCGKRPWHGDATAEKIKFKPYLGHTCTFEGTMKVEFNKDLLNKVCGIDPDD